MSVKAKLSEPERLAGQLPGGVTVIVNEGQPGPGTMTVTIDEEGMASHTAAEIYAHVQSGGTAVLDYEDLTYVLVGSTADYASFDHSYDDDLLANCLIYNDGSVEQREYNKVGSAVLLDKITVPPTAKVGQTIVVKSVDKNGRPTEWEAADLPKFGYWYSVTLTQIMPFEVGMTWEEYCDSIHNHHNFYYDEDGVYDENGDEIVPEGEGGGASRPKGLIENFARYEVL